MLFAILLGFIIALIVVLLRSNSASTKLSATNFSDAIAEARHWNERLGSQILTLSGTDKASTQALADASERHTASSAQIQSAQTPRQAALAREAALEGLYYIQAAREIMELPAGPALPLLEGQQKAGRVTEERTITFEGQAITASPRPTHRTPNYYPGGVVAGRPVPAGWYSTAWWAGALHTGMWAVGSAVLFSSMFGGMAGADAAAYDGGHDIGGDTVGNGDILPDDGDGDGGFFDGDMGGGFFDGGGFDF
ncbi:DUF1542 domain-containing protein [Corynebacterium sp. ES2794-CONJ1]|nr:DUF1542 domain-containing protein [Corynebacterium sp. ES2794-CONJ1]MCU9519941.1 DUF1542 domain-containing protein [Corynebacterium sp. ES2794-CONJ1]